jgi:hypothetical protein
MANEVAVASKNFYEKYGEAATNRSIVGRLLKFNKFGEYRAGQEEQEIKRGTALAAVMPTLTVGFVRWQDNRPVESVMGLVADGFIPPARSELSHADRSEWDTFEDGTPRDPWQFSNSLIFVHIETDEIFTFSTPSKGGLSAIGELSKAYGKRIRQKPDEVPVVELAVGSYQHSNRAYGQIRYPIFEVIDWIPIARLPPIDGFSTAPTEDAPLPLPAPKKAGAKKF